MLGKLVGWGGWRNLLLHNPLLRNPLVRNPLTRGVCIGLLAVIGIQAYHILLGGNFHTVLPGRVFRCAQPSAAWLERIIKTYGIRTVINLRGDNVGEPWYHAEWALAKKLGVRIVDIGIWGTQPAPEGELRLLVDAIQHEACPMLLHCGSGADRTGIASALTLLLLTDASLAEARDQLSLRFGHTGIGGARNHNLLLKSYESWLAAQGLEHEAQHLRRWVDDVYRKDELVRYQ